jgi:CRISPR-associated protein Cas1
MPALCLLTPGTRVSLVSERLHVEVPASGDGEEFAQEKDVLLNDVEHVILTEHVHVSMPALAELMRREIPAVLTSHGERILGICLPPAPHTAARLAQYRRAGDGRFALALAINWVDAKIMNSRRVLQRLAANREDVDVTAALAFLEEIARKCRQSESLDTLRGYEGTAAGRYFEEYGRFFPTECPFERRSRRPPHNAVNAILSFAYTVMTSEMECRIHAAGLDPAVGFFHELADRRPSLALDLVEPFRAPVADAMALDLVSHGTLNPREHFQIADGGVYLNVQGRKRFFVAYERRMNRHYHNEQTEQRTTLRDEFGRQVQGVKNAVLNEEPFEPFLMN